MDEILDEIREAAKDKPEILEIIDEIVEKIKSIIHNFYEMIENLKDWYYDVVDFLKAIWNLITGKETANLEE